MAIAIIIKSNCISNAYAVLRYAGTLCGIIDYGLILRGFTLLGTKALATKHNSSAYVS
jgi:hypothetical protein